MYDKLNELYYKTRVDMFSMAITYLIEKGTERVKALTDDDINSVGGNGLMTTEYVHSLMRTARDIANTIDNPIEIVQFCDTKGIFETGFYTNGECADRQTLEKAVRTMSNYILYDDTVNLNSKELLADYLDMEIDELESLLD